jgi:hypothetical protein
MKMRYCKGKLIEYITSFKGRPTFSRGWLFHEH